MKSKSLFGIIAVIAALAVVVSTSIPSVVAINPTNHIIEEPIRSGEDDGFVTSLLSQGNLINDSSSISIGQEAEDVFSLKFSAYLRFSNITLPTNAKISKAYITVVPTFTNQTAPLMQITAANHPNPTAPKNYSDYLTRNKTEASVDWNASYWYEDVSVNSPDISGIIQELVDSYDYSTGAPILIFLDDIDEEIRTKYQVFAAYEHTEYESAKLHIEYITEKEEEYKVHNINIGKGFPTIQAAIDDPDTQDGNTISVDPGTYFEHLVIDKPLKLIGEDKNTTIIECGRSGKCVHVTADNVEISGFTIQNGTDGILLESSNGCIIDNNIISYHCEGIYLSDSNNNLIAHNSLHNNGYCISGIHLSSSHSNEIRDNDLVENAGSVSLSDSNNNLIYHNNFVDNTEQAYDNTGTNSWDNGPVEGGNYWSDHGCIGNPSAEPYTIDTDGVDHYPFQDPNGWLKENQPPSTPTLYDPGTTDTDGKYSVSWSAVSGATSYTLEEDTSSSFSSPTIIHSGAGTSRYITNRSNGTYYYRVKACNACGCSGWSNVEDIKVNISNIIRVPLDYPTIHAAVDAASSGNIIIVRDGTYTENIDVNKPHLTIISENGAENCIVQAANSNDHVFEVTADYVNISGFTVEGATASVNAGIYLGHVNFCNISKNNASNNFRGIYLWYSSYNILTYNTISNTSDVGIDLEYFSFKNRLINNDVTSNKWHGICFWNNCSNNTIINNMISNNNQDGIHFEKHSSPNIIYGNSLIKNGNNVASYRPINIWNSPSKITYTYNGNTYTNNLGNYWDDYTGSDADGDGIGDTPYSINGDKDNYPLMERFENYFAVHTSLDYKLDEYGVIHQAYNEDYALNNASPPAPEPYPVPIPEPVPIREPYIDLISYSEMVNGTKLDNVSIKVTQGEVTEYYPQENVALSPDGEPYPPSPEPYPTWTPYPTPYSTYPPGLDVFQGVVTRIERCIGSEHYNVSVDEWISRRLLLWECDEIRVSMGIYPPMGFSDVNISKGDRVEVCGELIPPCTVNLNGERYYIKKIGDGEKRVHNLNTGESFSQIQAAIDDSDTGHTITVDPGTYTENVDVTKSLTIKSTSGNPTDTIVQALDPNDYVFNVAMNNVKISGFTVKGATGWEKAGIILNGVTGCVISNNDISDSDCGISLVGSNNNCFESNSISNNEEGICLYGYDNPSNNNVFIDNNVLENKYRGVRLEHSSYNIFTKNTISGSGLGIWLYEWSNNNKIHLNNILNNEQNVDSSDSSNIWNSPELINYKYKGNPYTNYLGNYWDDYKEKYPDAKEIDSSGIRDTAYSMDSDQDNYPLKERSENYVKQIRIINFSDHNWIVKSGYCRGPGPNHWSDSEENVWVDDEGLHLKIINRSGTWYCAEISSTDSFGYGKYTFYLDGHPDLFDKKVVLGLFTYLDDFHEIDIEFSGAYSPNNSQYVIQPTQEHKYEYIEGDNWHRFQMTLSDGDYSTHYFDWRNNIVYFKSMHGHRDDTNNPTFIIAEENLDGGSIAEIPTPADETVHLNLYLDVDKDEHGDAPSNGQEVEIIIKDFNFTIPEHITIGKLIEKLNKDPESVVNKKFATNGWVYVSTHEAWKGVEILNDVLMTIETKAINPLPLPEPIKQFLKELLKYLSPANMWDYCFGIHSMGIMSISESDQRYNYFPLLHAYAKNDNLWPEPGSVVYIEGTWEKRTILWKTIGYIFRVDKIVTDKTYVTPEGLKDLDESTNVKMMALIAKKHIQPDNTYKAFYGKAFEIYLKLPEDINLQNLTFVEIQGELTSKTSTNVDGKKVLKCTVTVDNLRTILASKAHLESQIKNKETIIIDCPVNATITDQYGRSISDDGINEMPGADMFVTEDTKIFYLPADLTYSTEIDAYDTGTFNFTRFSPIGNDISITKFENIPVTSNTKASVEIEPGVTDYTMSIDYNGDGVTDEEKSPDVSEMIEVTTPTTIVFEDDFSELNLNTWIPFGSPSPRVLTSVEGRTGVFDNNGDANCNSGVVSKDNFSFSNGFTIESDIYLDVTNVAGCWNSPVIGLTRQNKPTGEGVCPSESYPMGVIFGIEYDGAACWGTPPEKRRHAYFNIGLYTEDGTWESVSWLNADNYTDAWHNFKIAVGSDRNVKFYVDNELIYTSKKRINETVLQEKKIFLGIRSSGSAGKSYHDYVNVYATTTPSTIDFAQHSAADSGDFVILTNDGRVYEIDPRHLSDIQLRTAAGPVNVVAVIPDLYDDSILAFTGDGKLYQCRDSENWANWNKVGDINLPSGSKIVDFAQHSAADSGDFVILTNDGRVYEVDPRHLSDIQLRTAATPVNVAAVIPDRYDNSILAVTSDGVLYRATTDDDWNTWEQVGRVQLSGGSKIVGFAQHSAVTTGDFVFLTGDGKVYEVDPRRLSIFEFRTANGPSNVVAMKPNTYDNSILAVTDSGVLYRATTDDNWNTWTQVGYMVEYPPTPTPIVPTPPLPKGPLYN